jgi:positive regulator of sigma E activity
MSFLLYVVGLVVFISGTAWIATAFGAPQVAVAVAAAVVLALGVLTAAVRGRVHDPA